MPTKYRSPYPRIRGEAINLAPVGQSIISQFDYYLNPNTTVNQLGSHTLPGVWNGEIMHDVVTPSWREDIAAGKILNNSMSKERRYSEATRAFNGVFLDDTYIGTTPSAGTLMHATSSYVNYVVSPADDARFPAGFDVPYIEQTIRQEAINKAYANSHQRKINAAVDLAEMRQTTDMIRTNLGRVEAMMNSSSLHKMDSANYKWSKSKHASKSSLRSYRGKTPLGRVATATDAWLEAHYGLLPAMSSINGLMNALGKQVERSDRLTFRGSDSWNNEFTKTNTVTWTGLYGASGQQTFTTNASIQAYARAGILTCYRPGLQQRLGMEFRDTVPAAYDLVPFSFVADWVYDLGTYLEAITPVPGWSNLASWVTLHVVEDNSYHFASSLGTAKSSTRQCVYPAQETECIYRREHTWRQPNVHVGLPNLRVDLKNINHLVTGVALGVSSLNGSRIMKQLLHL